MGPTIVVRGGEKKQLPPSDGTSCPNCGHAWNQHNEETGACPQPFASAVLMAERVLAKYYPPKDQLKMSMAIERCKHLMSKHRMHLVKGGLYAPGGGLD